MHPPDYDGGGLVNLVAEIEHRFTGSAPSPRLYQHLAAEIPPAETYVLALIDGVGDLQLSHPAAAPLRRARRAALDTSFSSQTSVVTATLATGLPPARHGLIAYLLLLEAGVVNTIWWATAEGTPLDEDLETFLPAPNLAERLAASGVETVVVEPAFFVAGRLDRVLYRGARTVGSASDDDTVARGLAEAAVPGRLVLVYLPHVDAAAHTFGQQSSEYAAALQDVGGIWSALAAGLPPGAILLGTADHGHVDVGPQGPTTVEPPPGITLYGDSRVLYVRGDPDTAAAWAAGLAGTWVDGKLLEGWWGPGPEHPRFRERTPDGLVLADPGVAFLYEGNSMPMVGFHGGITDAERLIPLLVG